MNIIQTDFTYRNPLIPLDLDNVNYIIVHHPGWGKVSPEEIHEDVLADPNKKDWSGFPYNEYIRKDGTVYIGRGDHIGSQCQGMNSKSYGICCEGNYDVETDMPELQKRSLVDRIKFNKARFSNLIATVPHKYFGGTSCPGKYFPMTEILKRIEVVNVTLEEAKQILLEEKVVNSMEYWQKVIDTTIHFDQFIINVAKKIKELKGA